jgi:hypothetical protein
MARPDSDFDGPILMHTYEFAAYVGSAGLSDGDYFDFGEVGEVVTVKSDRYGHYVVGTVKGTSLEHALENMIGELRMPFEEQDLDVQWSEKIGTTKIY